MPSNYYTTFVFERKFRSIIFFLWLVGCCTKVIKGGNPLLAGRQLVELRLGRQRHLQDSPRQGHFKIFNQNYAWIKISSYCNKTYKTFKILRDKVTSKILTEMTVGELFPNSCFPFSIFELIFRHFFCWLPARWARWLSNQIK